MTPRWEWGVRDRATGGVVPVKSAAQADALAAAVGDGAVPVFWDDFVQDWSYMVDSCARAHKTAVSFEAAEAAYSASAAEHAAKVAAERPAAQPTPRSGEAGSYPNGFFDGSPWGYNGGD